MARVAGVDLPNKPIAFALRYIYGIGPSRSKLVLGRTGIDGGIRAEKLTDDQIALIRKDIDTNYRVEGNLRREVSMNIKRLMDNGSYRGSRHKKNLPVRGQRTNTNARTRKGPRKTVAGKKQAPTAK